MAAQFSDPTRRIVPRWRPSWVSTRLDELTSLVPRSAPWQPNVSELEMLLHDWKAHRTSAFAADVVGVALVLGQRDLAREAATTLLEIDVPAPAAMLAWEILRVAPAGPQHREEPPLVGEAERRGRVKSLRARLAEMARNPLMWVDLAREYVILGQNDHALRAIRAAVALAPTSRFVLRSAARFYLHRGDPGRAHDLLRRSPVAQRDPWVLAAEIATATVADRTSSLIKVGRRMIEGERLANAHLTELASALATLEMDAGNRRGARKLFLQALAAPTENTVAQASWASRHAHVLEFDPEYLELPRTFEAGAWQNYLQQDWSSAVAEADHWQLDEPFASRPAMFGSFVASVALEDYSRAVLFAERGLQADPVNSVLLNNLAFALASSGRAAEARAALLRVPIADLDVAGKVANLATSGLVAYRLGEPTAGRALYEQAIQLAETAGLRDKRAWAILFLAREEIRTASPGAAAVLSRFGGATEHFEGPTRAVAQTMFQRLLERAAGRK